MWRPPDAVSRRPLPFERLRGYMIEYPIARAWADARATRIFGGTNEIMLEIVGRSLGL